MAKTAWPVRNDLIDFLQSAGILPDPVTGAAAKIDYATACTDALQQFESDTGYRPFMAASADSTRKFTPKGGRYLDLQGGLPAAPTSVTIGVDTVSAGTVQTINEDFYMEEANAPAEGRPYTSIRFATNQTGAIDSIRIPGKWGFCANGAIPEHAWNAVLRQAALIVFPQVRAKVSQGLVEWRRGDETKRWGEKGAFAAERDEWACSYNSAVMRYIRDIIV